MSKAFLIEYNQKALELPLLLEHFDQSFVALLSHLRERKPLTLDQQLFIENRLTMLRVEHNAWATEHRNRQKRPSTLGDVLYAKSKAPVSEHDWATLVQSIAEGDTLALHALYDRAHCLVFTLIMRIIVNNRETAEELTLNVFHDIWRRQASYDPANGTVLGWIMNQARSQLKDRLLFESTLKRIRGVAEVNANPVVLRPTPSLQRRLAFRIAAETGKPPVLPSARRWSEPKWEQVAPGIECKLLATDTERHRVSMLVRLAPGATYPAHTHAGVEELHLLDGELWIDERKFFPGDYNYGAPGAGDDRVWSETGCTCVLITSTEDVLR